MAAASSTCSEITNDGPVLNLINKRLRAMRKKLNRIAQMEDSLAQGKPLNKEQEETLRSKSSVLAGIDELEKLRQPLLQAVGQEIELALEKQKQNPDGATVDIPKQDPVEAEAKPSAANDDGAAVSDLLNLLYFGSVFDVNTLMRAHDNMLTRTHERNCCLTYDYVTDDEGAADPLKERDLDLISMLGGLLISRPFNSSLSHKNTLQQCVEHAKLWIENADQPIDPDSDITYAGLREKLNKIMASDYFTTTPEIKVPVEVAAAGGNYTSFQVPVQATVIPPVEGSGVEYQQEEEQSPNTQGTEAYVHESSHAEEHKQGEAQVENSSEIPAQTEQGTLDAESDQNSRDVDSKEQFTSRKSYQNNRARGGGGARRGYSNGRGGRGGNRGGGHQNGRGQSYDQPGSNYYPKTNNYRGRGGRGMGGNYNNYPGPAGHAQEAS